MKNLILLLLLIPQITLGQIDNAEDNLNKNEFIEYYSKDWVKTIKSKAKYYRIYQKDSVGNIKNVRDYYLNGNLQGKADGAIRIEDNDINSIFTGNTYTYDKKGNLTYYDFFPQFNWKDEASIKNYFDKNKSKHYEGIWELNTRNGSVKLIVYYNQSKRKYNFRSLHPYENKLIGSFEPTNELLFTFAYKGVRTAAISQGENVFKLNFGLQGKKRNPYSQIRETFFYNSQESTLYKTYPNNSNSNINYPKNKSGWSANGSGIIVSKTGFIVTNYHVIEEAVDIEVEFILNGELQKFNADIVQTDKLNDLAVIKISDMNFDGIDELNYNFKTTLSEVGTKVYAFGYPMALSIMGKEIKVTDGIISSKTGFEGNITTYQITAPIQGGNSGGPLFDDKGNFLGVNSSGLRKDIADNVGYTIKSSYVLNIIDVLPESIDLPSSNKLQTLPLTTQIKEISKCVVLIKVNY